MKLAFSDNGWDDYLHWQAHDKKILKRINLLLEDIRCNPDNEHGLGKPERLKDNLTGYFSRRITAEHRLIYTFVADFIVVAQCRYHY
jgi:toxin YoeB